MASIINADDGVISGAAGIKLSADTSGDLNIQTNGVTAISVSASQVVSFPATTGFSIASATITNLVATSATVSSGSTLNGGVVINELGADADTRIEGDTDANLFFVDASTDRIGIGTDTPAAKFDIVDGANNSTGQLRLTNSGSFGARMGFVSTSTNGRTYQIGSNFVGGAGEFSIYDATASAERLQISASGSLGLGVVPSAWNSSYKVMDVSAWGSIAGEFGTQGTISLVSNCFANSTGYNNWTYKNTAPATRYKQYNGEHQFFTAPSGTAGNTISFTTAMVLDASGNLGLGVTSMSAAFELKRGAGTGCLIEVAGNNNTPGTTSALYGQDTAGNAYAWNRANQNLYFGTNNTERARITSGGLLLVNVTTSPNSSHRIAKAVGSQGDTICEIGDTGTSYFIVYQGGNVSWNAAASAAKMGSNSTNSRSLNASGTLNASGADYAEYMEKVGDFALAKGDVCGIDASGKLTNVFSDSVSFVVKSTNPSYVGGDSWGIGLEGEELEAARQKVDRIAFAGQVPVNVLGATPGQYIVPVDDNGAIKGMAVSNPTFEQYQLAVGKVIAIEDDGRARIIVKVA